MEKSLAGEESLAFEASFESRREPSREQIKLRNFQKAKTVIALQKMCCASLIDKVREIVFLRTIAN